MSIAFSTSWNSCRHHDGRLMVEEILSLGFRSIELSHGLSVAQLEGVLAAGAVHNFTISSVHNFLPRPVEIFTDSPDCYEFTSHREDDRSRAAALTRQSIDWAARLGARSLVLHTGRIRSLNISSKLQSLIEAGGIFSKTFCSEKIAGMQARERLVPGYIQRILPILKDLSGYADQQGVRLGIENREHFEAVPGEREMHDLLEQLDSPAVGYWHDFGHAQIKQNMTLLDHARWLSTIAPMTIGCHLHDVKWPFRDHCAPFTGGIDFPSLLGLLPDSCQIVWELSPSLTADDVQLALAKWMEHFPDRPPNG